MTDHRKIDFDMVKDVIMPFGKHQNKSLDKIASSDRGLLYLDWLAGQDWLRGDLKECVEAYLADEAISKALESLIAEGKR